MSFVMPARCLEGQTESWVRNAAELGRLGVSHRWRKARGDVLIECIYCGGVLHLHETRPMHRCDGADDCASNFKDFDEVIEDLAGGKTA